VFTFPIRRRQQLQQSEGTLQLSGQGETQRRQSRQPPDRLGPITGGGDRRRLKQQDVAVAGGPAVQHTLAHAASIVVGRPLVDHELQRAGAGRGGARGVVHQQGQPLPRVLQEGRLRYGKQVS
jgi:hypothetical protein